MNSAIEDSKVANKPSEPGISPPRNPDTTSKPKEESSMRAKEDGNETARKEEAKGTGKDEEEVKVEAETGLPQEPKLEPGT